MAAAAAAAALARLAAAFLLLAAQVACEYGMVHVVSESGGPRGKDYCILYNPQWAHLPHDLSKASLLQLRDWTASVLCSPPDLPAKGFSNQIPLVARGNCTFYEKVRLAQGGGARGLLIVSRETLVPPGGNKTQYEEIGIPVALLSYKDMLDIFKSFGRSVRAALYAPNEPMLDYNMVIIFVMAVGTVALGGYWAGSRDVRKRYVKHKRDDGPEKQEDEAVDVTPVMICVFVVMCCSMLVLLYYFYDQLGAPPAHQRGSALRPVPPLAGLGSPGHLLAGFRWRSRRWGERGPPSPARRRGPLLGGPSLSLPGAGHPARVHGHLEPFLGRGAGWETQAAPGPQCSPRPAVYVIIGIFCLSSSTGLYSCLSPLVQRLPFGRCRVPDNSLPYFHKRPRVSMLLLALLCLAVSVVWGVFRNEDQWAWILQDALGVAFCLYMLKTIRLPTFKACTLLLLVLFVYDVFFVFITPFLTKSGNSIMVEVATGPSDSATHEKLPMVLKVPRLNASPLALCDRPFSLLGFGDILVPGLLVAYCHRFDIQVQSSRVYFVACTVAYGIGLLVTFMALALMQRGQPALLYLVPCTLMISCALALWRRELGMFWTGSGFAKDLPQSPWAASSADGPQPQMDSDAGLSQPPPGEGLAKCSLPTKQSPALSAPEETGARAPPQEPTSPASRTPEPTGPVGTSA
ncbi:signal peptide peptidase-like 2B isoform X2 [Leopardus geoffroyi]|uniref:signal peptide peptidase-like 2B isoform X2 n=1 Tax=Leopardus geoffroyi TaxID=46844 RepID=UPI001E2600C2|nr:signal peptide peptidase-like 2B isoform X2 [Leopardus geoffroyi]